MDDRICGTWINQYGNQDKQVITANGDGSYRVAVCADSQYEKVTISRFDNEGRLPAAALWGPCVFTFVEPGVAIINDDPNQRCIKQDTVDNELERLAHEESHWEVMGLTDVPRITPIQNTGAVHNAEDMLRSRQMCLQCGCGGFVVRGGASDAQGHEVDPPRGFLLRKTQAELRALAVAVSPSSDPCAAISTLWLAPSAFTPDTGFKPGRDPSPALHIWWKPPGGSTVRISGFVCQVRVDKPVDYTYYQVCGFHCGYCGIQQHSDGKQQLLFSVWDAHGVDRCKRVQAAVGDCSEERFDGEGCGTGTWVTNDNARYAKWTAGNTYTFCVRAIVAADKSASTFICDFYSPDQQAWHRLGIMRRPQPVHEGLSSPLHGLYSFVEEFGGQHDRRTGLYGPAWVQREGSSNWEPVVEVKTTSTVNHDILPCQRASPCGDFPGCVLLETGGDALECPGPYIGPVSAGTLPRELSSLTAL